MSPPVSPPKPVDTKTYAGSGDPIAVFAKASGYSWRVKLQLIVFWTLTTGECAALLTQQFPYSAIENFLHYRIILHDKATSVAQIRITYTWLAGFALMYAGATLRLACYRTLGKLFTWELVIQKGHTLIETGPYSFVRHPGYTAVWMISIGVLLCQFGPGSWYTECIGWKFLVSQIFSAGWVIWSILIPATLMTRVNTEDAILRQEFGRQWDTYAQNTPWKLIPYIY